MLRRVERDRPGLPPWWVETLAVVTGYLLYQVVQIVVAGSRDSAVDRARSVWAAEQHLHVAPELWLNHLVATHHWLATATGLYYGILHFAVTPLVLVWLRVRRRGAYAGLRNVLVGTSVVALVAYWLLPLAPPRLSIPGIVDTLKVNDILSAGSPTGPASLANQYAAMPSLHVAWAVWVALAMVTAFPAARWRQLAWAYPAATAVVVVATGNHFLADVAAGALLVWAVAAVVARTGAWSPGREAAVVDLREQVGGGTASAALATVSRRAAR